MESRPQNLEFRNNPENFHPCCYCDLGQIKKRCGSGYPTVPNFLPPTLNFFSPNFYVEKKY